MSSFDEFLPKFFTVFTTQNFYQNKTYLDYINQLKSNDEDNIVGIKIVLPLLLALGFEASDIARNLTCHGKESSRPSFEVRLASSNVRCFLVEDKHTAYTLNNADPLRQLMGDAPSRGYDLGLVCNGRLLLGWDLSNQGHPELILRLNLEEVVQTYLGQYSGQNLLAEGKSELAALTLQQLQDLKSLYRRFGKQAFADLERLIEAISQPEDDWENGAISQTNNENFDELLISDLKFVIDDLEEDIFYQLNLLLEEYEQYARAAYIFHHKAEQVKQNITHAHAIKTYELFVTWRNLMVKTVLPRTEESMLRREFSRETAYVYVIRLLMVRICEDKKLLDRKFSNSGFKYWKEEVEPRYLDLARGMSMDYLLEMSYRSAQSIYSYFFDSADLFNWYRISANTIINILYVLNRFNLAYIDSDIIGMVYGRYVEAGKHEQGRYFTPKLVVEYMLDRLGYCANNPDIRDKTLLDPAGGSGSFLVHAARRLIDSYRSPRTGEIPVDSIPSILQQVKNNLFCLDINPFACYLAETNLLIQVIDLLKQAKDAGKLSDCRIDRFNVYNTDSLLLPRAQEIRTPLLNPVLDFELSTLSQLKTRTGDFAEGFDFIVGNPPYVRADEPGTQDYRQEIAASGRFETLYEKWDLFVPFIELACKTAKDRGKIGLIVSRGIQTNNYAEKLRAYVASHLTIVQIDFFNHVKLFSDAVVNNTILFFENATAKTEHQVKRILHSNTFETIQVLPSLNQSQYQAEVFRQFVMTEIFDNTLALEEICYCTVGMVLNSDESTSKGTFKKDDLIASSRDKIHPKAYLDGENIKREFAINQIRYLEWHTPRVPGQIRRATVPELYEFGKILFGMTSFPTYDRGAVAGDGFYVPDSVRICVRWDDVYKISRLENEPRQMYEFSKQYQKRLGDRAGKKIKLFSRAADCAEVSKQFDLRYVAAILASSLGKRLLLLNNRDENIMSVNAETDRAKSRIYPDDLKEFPIKSLSPPAQQPFIHWVDALVDGNWQLYALSQWGHRIQFSYSDSPPSIDLNFKAVFSSLVVECWSFLNAEPQCFEVTGDRHAPLAKIKIRGTQLLNGRDEFLRSSSPLVLQFLARYLQGDEWQGMTWSEVMAEGKIPKTEAAIAEVFAACDRLRQEIHALIDRLRCTYQTLDTAVSELYSE